MSERQIINIVEIDIDQCTLEFGVSPCSAAFGQNGCVRKCFNSYNTCYDKGSLVKGTNTLRFVEPSFPIKGQNYIPALRSVTGREQEVNISGYTPNIGGLGVRASVKVTIDDFPDRDTLTDKYWDERISGAAQMDGVGYDPINRGSFWTKFKTRNPNYSGRSLRVIEGYLGDDGVPVYTKTRSYVMEDMRNDGKSVTITAKDILALATNTKAQCPKITQGRLLNAINISQTTAILTPAGIGELEYPAAGEVVIGTEVMRFTRTGDNLVLVRGVKNTIAAAHAANDTVQVCYSIDKVRADIVIRDLLVDNAKIPSSYIPFDEWKAEFDRWGPLLLLSTTITKPTGVVDLIGEINLLGITLWWDEVSQKIKLILNHPPAGPVKEFTDSNQIMSINNEDNDDQRATRIQLLTVQNDPTKGPTEENLLRRYINVFVDGELPQFFDQSVNKTIVSRWVDHGDDASAKILTQRMLNRYKIAPVTYDLKVDVKDDVQLGDVIAITSTNITDDTGLPIRRLAQVYYRTDDKIGSTVKIKAQRFQFDELYGVVTENTRPTYPLSNDEQKKKGTYIAPNSGFFSDGRPAYQLV